jgi:hypothetical protein
MCWTREDLLARIAPSWSLPEGSLPLGAGCQPRRPTLYLAVRGSAAGRTWTMLSHERLSHLVERRTACPELSASL